MEKLSKDQQDMLKSINEKSKNAFKAFEKFRTEEYPKKSLDEKIAYWAESIQTNMKWQGDLNGDAYDGMFTKQWFADNTIFDPEFEKIFSAVATQLQLDMDKVTALRNA